MQSNLYEFQKRQIDLIVRVTPYAMVGHVANSAVITIALVGTVRPVSLIIWCAYSCCTALLLLFRHVMNRGRSPRSFQRATKKVTIYAFFLALPWSGLPILYLGSLSPRQELILVALGIGMAACATVLLSAIPRAAFSYMSVILIPSALKCLFVSQQGYALLGALAFSYWGCLAALIAKTNRDIREREEAELALTERNSQLALAGQAALVGSHADDPVQGRMTISDGYAAIHGLPAGTTETTRAEWRARVHPEDLTRVEEGRTRNFRDKRDVYNVDYRIIRGSGEVRWIEARGIVSYDADGQPQRIIGINIDVTERKKAEALLKDSKTRLSDALAAGEVVAFEWDATTGRSRRSDNADHIMGLVRDGCLLKHVHPDDRDNFRTCIRGLSPSSPSYALTFRFVRPDGRQVWLEETARGEFDGKERLSRIKGLTRDITERKWAELALAERNAQLALAGRAALVGIYAYDVEAEKVQISEGYAAIFGFPEGTNEMPRSQWLASVHPEDRERMEDIRSGAFQDRQEQYNTEYRIRVPGRGVYWIEGRSFISYDGDGHPRRVVGVNIDVTERKRAEQRQGVLVAELDHRVKNVLASVSAVVSHTQRESTSVVNFVEALDGRIRSMATTHQLLSSSRWQGISLAELIQHELAPYATRHNTRIDGPEVLLKSDAGQAMAMMLHELATNAAKYGALSTEYGRVAVRWDRRLNGHARPLEFEWRESGGPPVVATGKPSYGTNTIRNLIPYELGGTVDLVLAPDGVCCRLELPADWLLSNGGEAFSESVTHADDSREKNAARHVAQEALGRDAKPYRKKTRGEISREDIESALRAIDVRIGESERRLFEHVKLMQRLKNRGTANDVTMAHRLQLNLEAALLLTRARRERLLKDLEQD